MRGAASSVDPPSGWVVAGGGGRAVAPRSGGDARARSAQRVAMPGARGTRGAWHAARLRRAAG